MDIYEEPHTEGVIDIAKAQHELRQSATINHEGTRRAAVAEITAAALLDIAASLRTVAADAELGILASGITGPPEPEDDGPTDDFLLEGDRVRLADDESSEVGTVVALSFSEGELVPLVDFGDGEPVKVWARLLERVTHEPEGPEDDEGNGPEYVAPTNDETLVHPAVAEDDEDPEPEDDFERSPLDALRELADEKPKKKGGKK